MGSTEKLMMLWFTDYLGIGYLHNTKGWFVFPVFTSLSNAHRIWRKQMQNTNEHALKMRFIEDGSEYRFILYPHPLQREEVNFGFYRRLSSSETYSVFKQNFSGNAFFTFAALGNGPTPEFLNESKLVSDIKFMKNTEVKKNSVEWLAEQIQSQIRGASNE